MPLPTTINTLDPRAQGLHCRIGENYYRLVTLADEVPRIRTAPLQPPRIDTSANPEDIRPEFGTIWSLSDFSGGEGLDFAHRRQQSERDPSTRYWNSTGIDVAPPESGEQTSISLLHRTESIETTTGVARATMLNGVLYATDGTNVRTSTDPLASTPSFSTQDPHAGQGAVDVLDLTSLGDTVYAALGSSGIHQRSGAWTHWSDLNATRVWAAKARVIASTGTSLYEAKSAGTSVLLHALTSGLSWTSVVDVGPYILASATDGSVYAFTLNETAGTLAIHSRHQVSRQGPITTMAAMAEAGLVFYATASDDGSEASFHRALIGEDGTLTDAQVIREFSGTAPQTIDAIVVGDDDVYFGQASAPELWRYDLTTGGRARHVEIATTAEKITYLGILNDRLLIGVDTVGYYREATTYVTSGWLITPLVDHFTSAPKSWAGLTLDMAPIVGGVVEVAISTNPDAILDVNHFSWVRVKRLSVGVDEEESPITAESRYIAVRITITASADGTTAPELRSVSTRSFPGRGDVILTLPVNTSDQVEVPGRARAIIPGLGRLVYESLKGVEGSSVLVELFDPPEVVHGVVEEVDSSVLSVTARGSLTLTSKVTIRGRRTGLVSTSESIGPPGTLHLPATLPTPAAIL